jgi:hypothetical protein
VDGAPPVPAAAPVEEPPVDCDPPLLVEPPVECEPPLLVEPPVDCDPPLLVEPPVDCVPPLLVEPPVEWVPLLVEPPVDCVPPLLVEPPVEWVPLLVEPPEADEPLEPPVELEPPLPPLEVPSVQRPSITSSQRLCGMQLQSWAFSAGNFLKRSWQALTQASRSAACGAPQTLNRSQYALHRSVWLVGAFSSKLPSLH